ncbi:MAG: hypothetical protein MJ138_05990 [Kiritimatiellae bacterium]|nr:hypothetical protein [Kiritimatiellia bacterium]
MENNSSIRKFFRRLRSGATRRERRVITHAFGTRHFFHAYDFGEDTIVFERNVWGVMDEHASVLVAEKRDLGSAKSGHVVTVTSGTHAVAAIPLLQGAFWDLAKVPSAERSRVMTEKILAANVVHGVIEISQRGVPCGKLVALDAWLTGPLGLSLADVVMAERNVETLEHYRRLGQEWRVKPLAWTETEMRAAIDASRKRIGTSLTYCHSAKGVHFFPWSGFADLARLAQTDYRAFSAGLRELVGTYDGCPVALARQRKFHGHHEIEFFGLARGASSNRFISELEKLERDVSAGSAAPADAAARMAGLAALYKTQLTHPELADDRSRTFVETLYMNLTGEIYAVAGDGTAPAFDDRRTALPGATFVDGVPQYHPGCDPRTEVLFSNLRQLMSKDEHVEYANVYELRAYDADLDPKRRLGEGNTREIVYKTDRRPLALSLVEKRLSWPRKEYGAYVLARIEAFKALGVELPRYRLLRHRALGSRRLEYDYYIRSRAEGDPLWEIPAHLYQCAGATAECGCEDVRVALELAFLMGDAAAQNMTMKKYDAAKKSPLYGVGKEIYRFTWDPNLKRMMPCGVSTCSVRGSCGWPDVEPSEKNFKAAERFYCDAYADTLGQFASQHAACGLDRLADRFVAGFKHRMHALTWEYVLLKTEFESFSPALPPAYGFASKWRFALASLAWQESRLDEFAARFRRRLGVRG